MLQRFDMIVVGFAFPFWKALYGSGKSVFKFPHDDVNVKYPEEFVNPLFQKIFLTPIDHCQRHCLCDGGGRERGMENTGVMCHGLACLSSDTYDYNP